MTTEAREVTTLKKMNKTLRRLLFIALPGSVVLFGLSLLMINLGVQPTDELESYRWLISHQDQLLAEQAGRFYWSEAFTGMLLGALAVALFVVALVSAHLLLVAKIAKVTAAGVLAEAAGSEKK